MNAELDVINTKAEVSVLCVNKKLNASSVIYVGVIKTYIHICNRTQFHGHKVAVN